MNLTDRIWELELRLDNDGGTDFLSRRLLLRSALGAAEAEAYQRGHHDGLRDAGDARFHDETAAEGDGDG